MEQRYICVRCQTTFSERVGWCPTCCDLPLLGPMHQRPLSRVLDATPQISSAADLVRAEWDELRVPAYPTLRLGPLCFTLLWGLPGVGKSSMQTRALDSIPGPVVLACLEEGIGPAVGERLSRLGVHRKDFHLFGKGSVDALVDLARAVKARALGIDSLQATALGPHELRILSAACRCALFCTAQATKAGEGAGSARFYHEADVVISIHDGRWRIEKSRFQAAGQEGDVICQAPSPPPEQPPA